MQACIRKEHKNDWERRTPLAPRDVAELIGKNYPIEVERSKIRIFEDTDYEQVGARLVDDCADARVILGIKEPPVDSIREGQVHLSFSHTIKGQSYNMGLLQRFLDQKATLIDYETMTESGGSRIIAFGRYAGIAGAVDSFYVAGQKFAQRNISTPLSKIKPAWNYKTISDLKEELGGLNAIEDEHTRAVIVGSGNVGKGCEDVCRWMGLRKISVNGLLSDDLPPGGWYVVLRTADVVEALDGSPFDFKDYKEHGSARYRSTFDRYIGRFNILLQAPYWEEKYPRQMPREMFIDKADQVPMVIGDISCDIGGSLACTLKESTIDEPAFTYLAEENIARDGISWDGATVMSIDHLPCELSQDASEHFSGILVRYLPEILDMDLSQPFEASGLSEMLQRATIVYRGELTPRYRYLEKFLKEASS